MFQCDDSGRHYRKHPVMPFSSRYSIPGFWTRDSPYLLHVDSFARSFRLLVTFALVLDVRGIPFFQILWTVYGRCSSLIERSQSECSRWVLDSTLWLCQFYLSAWVIRKKYVEFVRHAKPCIHNSENRMFLELSLFSCLLTLVYQLIVKIMCAFVHRCPLLLWSVKPFYSGMTRRNKLQYLIHIQDWVKAVVFRRSRCNLAFVLFYPRVLPPLCQECHENCTISFEFLL
jgi:hypothetical protein